MKLLNIILPILIGAVIGYCTNYLAIKMLFHPHKEIRVGTWRLPFTPGIIPKNQKRIAGAVANAVSEQLLTTEDLLENIRQGIAKEEVVQKISVSIFQSESSIGGWLRRAGHYEPVRETLSAALTDIIIEKITQADLQPIIEQIGGAALENILKNPMLAMFLSENVKKSIYEKLGKAVQDYAGQKGREPIQRIISEQIDILGEKQIREILQSAHVDMDMIETLVAGALNGIVSQYGSTFLKNIAIKDIIRSKIEAMDMNELESLVMSVMKQELQAVINLGALIGGLIGILNIFF